MTIQFSKHASVRLVERFHYLSLSFYQQLENLLIDCCSLERKGRFSATGVIHGRKFKIIFREIGHLHFLIVTLMWVD